MSLGGGIVNACRLQRIIGCAGISVVCACEAPLPGSIWNVEVVGAEDTCHDPPEPYAGPKTFEYRIEYDGADVTIALGEDPFATGTIAGCDINYHSVVWGEERDGYEIRWQLVGDAIFRAGGEGCNLAEGVDWQGTETFEIVNSENPDIEAGCTYALVLEGVYVGTSE